MDYFRIVDLIGIQIAVVILRSAHSADLNLTIPVQAFGYELVANSDYPFIHVTVHLEPVDEEPLEAAINSFCTPEIMNDRVLKILDHRKDDLRALPQGANNPYAISFTVH